MLKTMKLNKLKQIIKEEIQKLQALNEAEEYVGNLSGAGIFCDKCPCGCSEVITDYQPAGGGNATYAKCKSPCPDTTDTTLAMRRPVRAQRPTRAPRADKRPGGSRPMPFNPDAWWDSLTDEQKLQLYRRRR
jgi:hypothetical protein